MRFLSLRVLALLSLMIMLGSLIACVGSRGSSRGDDDDSAGFPSFEDDDDDLGVSGEEVTFGCMCSTSSSATPSTAWLVLGLLPLATRRRR